MSLFTRILAMILLWLMNSEQVHSEFISEYPGQYNYRMGMTYCSLCSYKGLLGGIYTKTYRSTYKGLLHGTYIHESTYLPKYSLEA